MAILKTSEQVRQAQPVIESQKWLLVVFETAATRDDELRRDSTRMAGYPEIRNSADILFFIDVPDDAEHVRAGMAADPSAPGGPMRIKGFIDWAAEHRLNLVQTIEDGQCPEIEDKLAERGYRNADGVEPDPTTPASARRTLILVLLAIGALALAFFIWKQFVA